MQSNVVNKSERHMQPHSHRHTHAVRVFHQSMGMCTYFTHAIETKQFCMHSTYILCTAYTIYLFFLLGFFLIFFFPSFHIYSVRFPFLGDSLLHSELVFCFVLDSHIRCSVRMYFSGEVAV